jgi:hypothetical protein
MGAGFGLNACGGAGGGGSASSEKDRRPLPTVGFSGDSAYHFVEKQVGFGPRVPNTAAHRLCGDYLTSQLERLTDSVAVQSGVVKAYDGTQLNIRNLMGFVNPGASRRVILCAHWDTRPFADFAEDPQRKREPILGANDGASGVAALLELARQFRQAPPSIGVQIIFFDAEDYGRPAFAGGVEGHNDTYCLGSQYWARRLPQGQYQADYAILLDMVGAPDAEFYQEGYSMEYAPWLVRDVWNTATRLGYSSYFVFEEVGYVTDDHRYINEIASIPSIDIIDYAPGRPRGFGAYWHTHDDDMDVVSPRTLEAVGRTVEAVVRMEEGVPS